MCCKIDCALTHASISSTSDASPFIAVEIDRVRISQQRRPWSCKQRDKARGGSVGGDGFRLANVTRSLPPCRVLDLGPWTLQPQSGQSVSCQRYHTPQSTFLVSISFNSPQSIWFFDAPFTTDICIAELCLRLEDSFGRHLFELAAETDHHYTSTSPCQSICLLHCAQRHCTA